MRDENDLVRNRRREIKMRNVFDEEKEMGCDVTIVSGQCVVEELLYLMRRR